MSEGTTGDRPRGERRSGPHKKGTREQRGKEVIQKGDKQPTANLGRTTPWDSLGPIDRRCPGGVQVLSIALFFCRPLLMFICWFRLLLCCCCCWSIVVDLCRLLLSRFEVMFFRFVGDVS